MTRKHYVHNVLNLEKLSALERLMSKSPLKHWVTRSMAVRMTADVLMMNAALISTLLLRFLSTITLEGSSDHGELESTLWTSVTAFRDNAWLLTFLGISVFGFNGFYTYGRAYQGRLKTIVITRSVLLTYFIFTLTTYTLWTHLALKELPWLVLLLSCAVTLALILASRMWTFIWETFVRPEREQRLQLRRATPPGVLVIGGAGYIGSALLPKLLDQGHRVRVLDLFLYGKEPIQNVAGHPALELMTGDFRNVDQVVSAVQGIDAVVHLGAIVGDPACDLDKDVTIRVNLSATQMIAQVVKASGIQRFVFASTCSVYGASDELLDEQSAVRPVSLYGETKLAAERGLQSMVDGGFEPTILRFATIYGLSGRTRFDLVVNLLAAKAELDHAITVHGGDQWRPFVHVDDAALAIAQVLKAPLPLVGRQILNVGSDDQNHTIQQVGELIHKLIPSAELVLEQNAVDRRNYRVRFQKIRELLDFQPQWTLEQGIRQVTEAIVSGKVTDYRDPKYSNVKFLRESHAIELIRLDDDWSRSIAAVHKHEPEPQLVVHAKSPLFA